MKVADLFVKCLEKEGVNYIFGVPGEENEALLFSLENSSIEFIPCRHEQGAAFIADAWGRFTGRAGVCLSTLGPGATNLITGVADANLDKAPLLAITAQGSLDRLHHESHQYLDVVQMFRPITKWNTSVTSPEIVTEVIRKAFKIAEQEKPGATHVELSEDMAGLEAVQNVAPIEPSTSPPPSAPVSIVNQAAALVSKADRPLIVAGRGAIRDRASGELTSLSKKFDIPVTCTFMGKGAISDAEQQSLFSIGLGFKDYVMEAMERADLVIAIGYDIAEYDPEMWNPGAEMPIIHIDSTPAEVYTHYTPSLELVGDISSSLSSLSNALVDVSLRHRRGWYAPIRERIIRSIEQHEYTSESPVNIPGALNAIRSTLNNNGIMISDVGSHKMWIARNFRTFCPDGCVISNGLASMGFALPAAIAASLIYPDRQIVAGMGDGGFLMNVQELETAARLGCTFTTIVFNDNDYGLISWKQRQSQNRSVSTRIANPDFILLAESFGIKAYHPANLEEFASMLDQSLSARELNLIALDVDPSVNDALIEELDSFWN